MDVKAWLEAVINCGDGGYTELTISERMASEILAHIRELEARAEKAEAKVAIAKQALEIIAGKSQCIDNLMGNGDVAESALAAMEAADE